MPSYPNRCQHLKVNGTQCGSPALRYNKLCYFHKRHHQELIELNLDRLKDDRARSRPATIELPLLEDANSIQVSLMQITRLLLSGQIDHRTAALLLYAMQTASANLRHTRFEPYMHDVVLDPRSVRETCLGDHIWRDSDFVDEPATRAQALEEARREAEKQEKLRLWAQQEVNRLTREGQQQREAARLRLLADEKTIQQVMQAVPAVASKPAPDAPSTRPAQSAAPQTSLPPAAPQHATTQEATPQKRAVHQPASTNVQRTAAVTPAGRAVVSPGQSGHAPGRRPPARVNMNEVREKVRDQIRKALPAIAAQLAQKQSAQNNGGSSG